MRTANMWNEFTENTKIVFFRNAILKRGSRGQCTIVFFFYEKQNYIFNTNHGNSFFIWFLYSIRFAFKVFLFLDGEPKEGLVLLFKNEWSCSKFSTNNPIRDKNLELSICSYICTLSDGRKMAKTRPVLDRINSTRWLFVLRSSSSRLN